MSMPMDVLGVRGVFIRLMPTMGVTMSWAGGWETSQLYKSGESKQVHERAYPYLCVSVNSQT